MPTPTPAPTPPDDSGASSLMRAQAAELQALRRQLASMPDPEALEAIRSKAARFDQLEQSLPEWQQQVQQAFSAEQQQAAAAIAHERQQLNETRLRSEVTAAYLRHGGLPQWADSFFDLIGRRAQLDDAGKVVTDLLQGESPVPFEQALQALEAHPQTQHLMALFAPRFGSGSNAATSRDVRTLTDQYDGMDSIQLMTQGLKK